MLIITDPSTTTSKLEHYSMSCISHLLRPLTTSLALSHSMGLISVYFYSNKLYNIALTKAPQCSRHFWMLLPKAFNRINHNLLFTKLIKRNVPMYIVKLLVCWYRKNIMQVNGTSFSDPSTVSNVFKKWGSSEPVLIRCLP